VVAHHERPDGTGYPLGLSRDEIPLEALILGVCDAYEAMTNDRPFREAMPPVAAQNELIRGVGRQFDAAVVHAFLSVVAPDEWSQGPVPGGPSGAAPDPPELRSDEDPGLLVG
jgi:HD-GYP domain-containing protein (c-di-GMP phosphodiesterase class II)